MATDNFLTTKSVLGLAERVAMCSPPEIIDLTDTTFTDEEVNSQHHILSANITDSSVTSLLRKLQIGQMAVLQFKSQFETGVTLVYNMCALIFKVRGALASITEFHGFGILDDGRSLYIACMLTSSFPQTNRIIIHRFGTATD